MCTDFRRFCRPIHKLENNVVGIDTHDNFLTWAVVPAERLVVRPH